MMGKLVCWSVRNVLDLQADGRLAPAQERLVERHLAACSGCLAVYEDLPLPASLLADLAGPAAPAGLGDAILEALERAEEPEAAPTPVWRLQPAFALSALVLVLVGLSHAGADKSAWQTRDWTEIQR